MINNETTHLPLHEKIVCIYNMIRKLSASAPAIKFGQSDNGQPVSKMKQLRQKAFDLIPVIIMTLQFGVLVVMMATNWFNKSPPEMPYDFTAPAGSLVLGLIMLMYNFKKHTAKPPQIPKSVLVVNAIWMVITVVLLVLALIYPERQCCCPGGVRAEKVPMGSCENKEPGAVDDAVDVKDDEEDP